ncbi:MULTISPECIES: ABC transporter ATP-binding protein [unclassified Pseudoalteromonas]|uniref:ABC transporter ATP-binding protein n=1 Tax=unclassified Pseudoalteromonas TaxID=194690 RepID=UPI0005A86043|nr:MULTISPECIES: ABC transporter ATP-binding protein [unclassified Pseudoalteromonas]
MISIKGLSFSWPKQHAILKINELEIKKGESIFLQGPSGSGKSTLLSLLAGINQPSSGKIEILNTNLNELSAGQRDKFRAKHIGYIFQMFNLLPYLSVIENVTLACEFSTKRKVKALQKSKTVIDEAKRLLDHLEIPEHLFDQKILNLSIGQQQRVASARALIGSPELLIADEPTSALDQASREAFIKLLFKECKSAGTTLLFVSHDETLKPLFERYVCLKTINEAC